MGRYSQRNRGNTRAGSQWEAQIDNWNAMYLRQRRAFVVKRGPPMRFLEAPRGGIARCRVEGKGPPDYGGVLAGGRAVEFEAKCTLEGRVRLELVKPHQGEALQAAHEMGALAFVALHAPSGWWVLPWGEFGPVWQQWREDKRRGAVRPGGASLTADEIDDIGERMLRPGDWLSALEG